MDHDQRFKTLLRVFFAEFLRLFFASWAERMDLANVEWLDKEVFADPPEGKRRALDMVAQVGVRVPVQDFHGEYAEPWLLLVHIEIEAQDQTIRVKPRLPRYYYHLRDTYGLPVLPIVISQGRPRWHRHRRVSRAFWGSRLEIDVFQYLYVGLPRLNGVEYVQGDNWLGVALAALMAIPPDRIAWLGAKALRRLGGAPLTQQQRFQLVDCVQAYLPMDEQQKQEYDRLLQTDVYAEVLKMNKTVFEEGIEKGIEKGRLLDRREVVLTILEERFGPPSPALRAYVDNLSFEGLRQLTLRLAKATSLEEAGLSHPDGLVAGM